MANPTTNFGWVMPTSTSLVTNLPADFNTFGQGVDTSMAQLKGGTTGQILSKTSATDMAFTWITPNPGDITAVTAGTGISGGGTSGDVTITNSMATAMTTKGDLVPATGSGTFSRLAIGTNGQVLTADSTAATGMKWNTGLASPLTTKGDLWTYSTTDARLAVGTNGQTLVADSSTSTGLKWATPAGGLTLISTQTVSNVATITFDSVFTSTYFNYLVCFHDIYNETTSSADLYFQFRYAGPTTNTQHTYAISGANSASSAITVGATNTTYALLSRNMGQSTYRNNGHIFVTQVGNDTRIASATGQTADPWGEEILNYSFFAGTARTYTGFIISTSTGNMSGTFAVYGLAKS